MRKAWFGGKGDGRLSPADRGQPPRETYDEDASPG